MKNTLEHVAARLAPFLPKGHDPVVYLAACYDRMKELRGDAAPADSHWHRAIQELARELARNPGEIQNLKARAAKVLSDPRIVDEHQAAIDAQARIDQAALELQELAEAPARRQAQRLGIQQAFEKLHRRREAWGRDFDAEAAAAKATIAKHLGRENGSNAITGQIKLAFEFLAKLPIYRELAPSVMLEIDAEGERLAAALAELDA